MMASAGAVLSGIMWLQQLHDHRWVAPVPYGPRPRSNAQPNRPSIDYATALDVVAADGAPVDDAGQVFGPALDACEEALDPWAVALDGEARRVWDAGRGGDRHQIFRAGEDEDIRLLLVAIERQALIGLPGDGWERESPAQAEGTVAGPGVVVERELWAEAGAAGADRNRNAQRAGAGRRLGRELLANTADGPTAVGQRNGR